VACQANVSWPHFSWATLYIYQIVNSSHQSLTETFITKTKVCRCWLPLKVVCGVVDVVVVLRVLVVVVDVLAVVVVVVVGDADGVVVVVVGVVVVVVGVVVVVVDVVVVVVVEGGSTQAFRVRLPTTVFRN